MNSAQPYAIEVFFDGACPLCAREMAVLRRWDRRGQIRFTDIAHADFDARQHGPTQDEFMAQMHGRLPDGTWLRGVEVFRQVYSIVGFRPLVALTRLPVVAPLLDAAYRVFARNRPRLTGRCDGDRCATAVGRSRRPGAN